MAETLYQIHNMVRQIETRLHRAQAAQPHRTNLLLGGGLIRVPCGRQATVTKTILMRLLPEVQRMEKDGMVKVTTLTGQRVDLSTFAVVETAPASAPLPTQKVDSVANDKTFEHGVGQHMPTVHGGKAVTEEVRRPEVLDSGVPEGTDDTAAVPEGIPEDMVERPDDDKPQKRGRKGR